MNLLAPISSIMTKNVKTVGIETSLVEVSKIFEDLSIHHLPVLDDGELVGMISDTDYLLFRRGFYENRVDEKYDNFRLRNHTAKDIMTKGLAKLDAYDKVNVALDIFKQNFLHALPVLDGKRLVGIVTTHDIIRSVADDKSAINKYVLK